MFPATSSNAMQHNTRIESDSIFASAGLHFTNQFSEFYHKATDSMQDLHYVNPVLVEGYETKYSLTLKPNYAAPYKKLYI